jgi:hypothetical protein
LAGGGTPLGTRTRHRFSAIGFSGGTLDGLDGLAAPCERPPGVGLGGRSDVQFGSSWVSVGGVTDACEPVFTMFLTFGLRRRPRAADQRRLADALDEIESTFEATPGGVLVHTAYGLPYFAKLPGGLYGELVHAAMPRSDVDPRHAALADGGAVGSARVESNDLLITLRSDSLRQLDDVRAWFVGLRRGLGGTDRRRPGLDALLTPTSTRVMFAQRGMPRRVADAARLPCAAQIDPDASMWLDAAPFSAIEAPRRHCVRVEPSPSSELASYFTRGAIQALDHMVLDLGPAAAPPDAPIDDHELDALAWEQTAGTASPANPLLAMGRLHGPGLDQMDAVCGRPTPKQHWTMFAPSVDHVARVRAERARIEARRTRPIRTTRHQDFIVPPRRHRAFPLAEIDDD